MVSLHGPLLQLWTTYSSHLGESCCRSRNVSTVRRDVMFAAHNLAQWTSAVIELDLSPSLTSKPNPSCWWWFGVNPGFCIIVLLFGYNFFFWHLSPHSRNIPTPTVEKSNGSKSVLKRILIDIHNSDQSEWFTILYRSQACIENQQLKNIHTK